MAISILFLRKFSRKFSKWANINNLKIEREEALEWVLVFLLSKLERKATFDRISNKIKSLIDTFIDSMGGAV
ncbi:hypothetical protein [Synechococcus sp. PCC 7502]|uniref:hypothetical protein n=1 Tax=Synechococcus sp. PCC 7502 TaxID=1173263 RepID=UPI0002D823E8|nr:hypothetical protein [Synechococcus sp. PCC 7502]